jgi:RNA polymerase sigma-70 factor, ECF subfamily
MPDIPKLVRRCQEGDLRAFAALFDHFQDRLFDVACAVLRDREGARDAVQGTFVTVFQKIDTFRGDAAFETWLIAILVNECRRILRRRKLRRTLSLENLAPRWLAHLAGQATTPGAIVAEREERNSLWALVNALDDRLRLPILLRYRYGFTCAQIAEMTGLSIQTIYEQLSQARRRLRQMHAEQEAQRGVRPQICTDEQG